MDLKIIGDTVVTIDPRNRIETSNVLKNISLKTTNVVALGRSMYAASQKYSPRGTSFMRSFGAKGISASRKALNDTFYPGRVIYVTDTRTLDFDQLLAIVVTDRRRFALRHGGTEGILPPEELKRIVELIERTERTGRDTFDLDGDLMTRADKLEFMAASGRYQPNVVAEAIQAYIIGTSNLKRSKDSCPRCVGGEGPYDSAHKGPCLTSPVLLGRVN